METHPIIRQAADLIYLPSPSGFFGISDTGKLNFGGSGRVASLVDTGSAAGAGSCELDDIRIWDRSDEIRAGRARWRCRAKSRVTDRECMKFPRTMRVLYSQWCHVGHSVRGSPSARAWEARSLHSLSHSHAR